MDFKRSASAHWEGKVKEGKGHLSTESSVLKEAKYAFNTRFENEPGTNPEELIGAALAGCFSMQLAANIGNAGFTPGSIDTKSTVHFKDKSIVEIQLDTTVKSSDISEEKLNEVANDAKKNCPISKLLDTSIKLNIKLK